MPSQGDKLSKGTIPDPPVISGEGATDLGKVRSGNEDCHRVLIAEKAPPTIEAIVVVADGMGGHAAGEVASKMTTDGVIRRLVEGPDPEEDYIEFLSQVVEQVNQDVHNAGQKPDYQGMGTTCTTAVLKNGKLHIANVGDSRAYILRDRQLRQITKDHSWVSEQVEAGNLTLEEASKHPYRNVVTRSIGTENQVKVDKFVEEARVGDKFLLCSDGLHSVVDDKDIQTELIRTTEPHAICQALIELANTNGGPDNITVVVVELNDQVGSEPDVRTNKNSNNKRLSRPLGWIRGLVYRLTGTNRVT